MGDLCQYILYQQVITINPIISGHVYIEQQKLYTIFHGYTDTNKSAGDYINFTNIFEISSPNYGTTAMWATLSKHSRVHSTNSMIHNRLISTNIIKQMELAHIQPMFL
jgi:hypothetical protein